MVLKNSNILPKLAPVSPIWGQLAKFGEEIVEQTWRSHSSTNFLPTREKKEAKVPFLRVMNSLVQVLGEKRHCKNIILQI